MLIDTLSIIVPAYNEAGNIEKTLDDLLRILKDDLEKIEIIVINDGSKDDTGKIIDDYGSRYPSVKPYHNNPNKGLGYTYRRGVELATMNYITLVPGDNEICIDSIRNYLMLTGCTDIVIPFIQNYETRPLLRQGLSKMFTMVINAISGLNITYYNGPVVHSAKLLKARDINTDGFAYQADLLVRMIKEGATFTQVSMLIQPREHGAANALNMKNLIAVTRTIIDLFKYCRFNMK
ncbi:MAG: glycosyltransferase family 2 protein [Nitrospinae bacterium]|nr:glycosyltransferase family 2 protein [Nitrospinota bacterium]